MLNILLSALGLPKRTEITPPTSTLRRVAGLEDVAEDLQERVKALEAYALECEKAIASLKRMCRPAKAAKPARRAKP
ncbi:MAG TPA: hypothetical protein DCZ59_06075 [Bacteroidetes bacterium]|nr:hypothetical protein [Bacteroidota bacterium]